MKTKKNCKSDDGVVLLIQSNAGMFHVSAFSLHSFYGEDTVSFHDKLR